MSPLVQRPETLTLHAGRRAGAAPIYLTTSYQFELAGGREAGRRAIDALELFYQRSRTQPACRTAMFVFPSASRADSPRLAVCEGDILPIAASLRNRPHRRTWAFQAMSRTGFGVCSKLLCSFALTRA